MASYIPLESLGADPMAAAGAALTTGVWRDHRFDLDEFESRISAAFTEIVAGEGDGRVVVVCHGGVMNSYLGRIVGRPRGAWFAPQYTSFCRLVVEEPGARPRLVDLNQTPHLSRFYAADGRAAGLESEG